MSPAVARRRILAFRVVYAALAANFILPAISYIVDPAMAVATMDQVNRLLGGGPWPVEQGQVWHMLAVGNVMTLGVLCMMLLVDLERFFPALPGLAFLKAFSAFYSLALGFTQDLPAFFGVFVLDGGSTVAMVYFAVRARAALDSLDDGERPLPWYLYAILLLPRRVQARLEAVERLGVVERVPNLWQVALGVLRMAHRVVFRPASVGTCTTDPVRSTWRARLLAFRPLRFPFLVAERAIAPFDFSGLLSSRERILRHLLGAHHDRDQFVYDLELLRLFPGALEELVERTRAVVDETSPRARYLKDLCVFERYHDHLLRAAEAALRGQVPTSTDPDITLAAYLAWCAEQPATPGETFRAWQEGRFRLAPVAVPADSLQGAGAS